MIVPHSSWPPRGAKAAITKEARILERQRLVSSLFFLRFFANLVPLRGQKEIEPGWLG
jgi:hypothetical protein